MGKAWKGVVIHCSDSVFGDSLIIDSWHKERGFTEVGYHFVITNGKKHKQDSYLRSTDGAVQSARSLFKIGSHARSYNYDYIGICLVGVDEFTECQMESLQMLVKELMAKYEIKEKSVIGHYQCTTANGKTCPNFDVDDWKQAVFLL